MNFSLASEDLMYNVVTFNAIIIIIITIVIFTIIIIIVVIFVIVIIVFVIIVVIIIIIINIWKKGDDLCKSVVGWVEKEIIHNTFVKITHHVSVYPCTASSMFIRRV